jgi:hypothetical protein
MKFFLSNRYGGYFRELTPPKKGDLLIIKENLWNLVEFSHDLCFTCSGFLDRVIFFVVNTL